MEGLSSSQTGLKKAPYAFATGMEWRKPLAVTLSLKQRIGPVALDEMHASANFRDFLNRVNRKVFGHAATRHGKTVTAFPVIERGKLGRLHYHAMIDCPEHLTLSELDAIIREAWTKTFWSYNEMKTKPARNAGWIAYILKDSQKHRYPSEIDWANVRRCPSA